MNNKSVFGILAVLAAGIAIGMKMVTKNVSFITVLGPIDTPNPSQDETIKRNNEAFDRVYPAAAAAAPTTTGAVDAAPQTEAMPAITAATVGEDLNDQIKAYLAKKNYMRASFDRIRANSLVSLSDSDYRSLADNFGDFRVVRIKGKNGAAGTLGLRRRSL